MKIVKYTGLFIIGTGLATLLFFQFGGELSGPQGVKIHHMAENYFERDGFLTVNVTGEIIGSYSDKPARIKFQLNDGVWQSIPQDNLRAPPPIFTIELHHEQLKKGKNCLRFSSGQTDVVLTNDLACFNYGLRDDYSWRKDSLDVQDGHWELQSVEQKKILRPVPGHEGYDRIVLLSNAFSGSRRITARIKFIERVGRKPFGFGILALWGGHADESDVFPRRGWTYGLAWYYSLARGVGAEIATKYADQPFYQTRSYRSYEVTSNSFYNLIVEALATSADNDNYQVRMKWWADGEPQPEAWLIIDEAAGKALPDQDYAVAALAHRAQVEFHDIEITHLDTQ